MAEELGREIGWEDAIEKDENNFEPLPAGVYDFTVESMERGRFPGSEKMAACHKASLKFVVRDKDGSERYLFDDLILNSKM